MRSRTPLLAATIIAVAVGCTALPPGGPGTAPTTTAPAASPWAPPTGAPPVLVADPSPGDTRPLRWEAAVADHLDVSYGPEPDQLGDLYLPSGGSGRGVIVVVHGGAFAEGDRSHALDWYGPVMQQLERGFAVFNVDYRLTDGIANVFPTAVHDVALAVDWVRSSEGADLGLDASTVLLAGHSAGGTLAALVALAANGDGTDPLETTAAVDGWLSMSGIYDFERASVPVADLGAFWLGAHRDDPLWWAAASPVSHLDPDDPPGLVVHGDLDPVVPVAQVDLLLIAAGRAGALERLHVDVVDSGADCRDHLPQCGMNSTYLDSWIDGVAERAV